MNGAPSSKDDSDQSFWNQAFFDSSFPPTTSHLQSDPTANYNLKPAAHDDLFELWCCSDELCLPFADQNGENCNLSNCPSTSASHPPPPTHLQPVHQRADTSCSLFLHGTHTNQDTCCSGAVCQQDLLDCDCCRAGCPPSPTSLQPCIECDQPTQNLLLRASPSITSTTTNQSGSRLLSPSLASNISRNEFDDFPTSQPDNSDTLEQDILWINKDLEELIKCCCCDEPTQSQTLPRHHATAHPTHHVNFDMFDRPSITFPYKPNHERPEPHSGIQSTASISVPCNEHRIISFKCQWKDCNLEFSDRFRLTEHVNVCHLFQPSPGADLGVQSESREAHPSRIDNLRMTPSDIIASQSEESAPMSTDSLTSRPGASFSKGGLSSAGNSSFNHSSTNCSNTAPCDSGETPILGNYQSCFDLSSHSNDSLAQPDCSTIPHSRDDNHNPSVQDYFISPTTPSTASSIDPLLLRSHASQNLSPTRTPVRQISIHSQHMCRWGSCTGRIFPNTAELTEHISTDHVGSGKSNYTCLWEGCYCITKLKPTKARNPEQEDEAAGIAAENCPGDLNNSRKCFSQRQKLMRHLQTHTGDKPFECESCGKKFGEMTTLVQHRRTHTNEKPYKCSVEGCGKSFALQSALTIHKRTHTGLKPFKCPVKGCAAQFSESSNLSKHMRTHSLIKKFKCTICGKRFTRSDQLTRHLKSESIHLHLNTNSADQNINDDDDDHVEEGDNEDGPVAGLNSQSADFNWPSTLNQTNPPNDPQIPSSGQEKRRSSTHPHGHQPKRTKKLPPAIK